MITYPHSIVAVRPFARQSIDGRPQPIQYASLPIKRCNYAPIRLRDIRGEAINSRPLDTYVIYVPFGTDIREGDVVRSISIGGEIIVEDIEIKSKTPYAGITTRYYELTAERAGTGG